MMGGNSPSFSFTRRMLRMMGATNPNKKDDSEDHGNSTHRSPPPTARPTNPATAASGSSTQKSPFSTFDRIVVLHDWWLVKSEMDCDGKSLAVAGIMHNGPQASRVFKSAPIVKRFDAYTIETSDGVTVTIHGLINRGRTERNGFPPEACVHFLCGFPYNWDAWAEKYSEKEFSAKDDLRSDLNSANAASGNVARSTPLHVDEFPMSGLLDLLKLTKYYSPDMEGSDVISKDTGSHALPTCTKQSHSDRSCNPPVCGPSGQTFSSCTRSKDGQDPETMESFAASVNKNIDKFKDDSLRHVDEVTGGQTFRKRTEDSNKDRPYGSPIHESMQNRNLVETMTGTHSEPMSTGMVGHEEEIQTIGCVPVDNVTDVVNCIEGIKGATCTMDIDDGQLKDGPDVPPPKELKVPCNVTSPGSVMKIITGEAENPESDFACHTLSTHSLEGESSKSSSILSAQSLPDVANATDNLRGIDNSDAVVTISGQTVEGTIKSLGKTNALKGPSLQTSPCLDKMILSLPEVGVQLIKDRIATRRSERLQHSKEMLEDKQNSSQGKKKVGLQCSSTRTKKKDVICSAVLVEEKSSCRSMNLCHEFLMASAEENLKCDSHSDLSSPRSCPGPPGSEFALSVSGLEGVVIEDVTTKPLDNSAENEVPKASNVCSNKTESSSEMQMSAKLSNDKALGGTEKKEKNKAPPASDFASSVSGLQGDVTEDVTTKLSANNVQTKSPNTPTVCSDKQEPSSYTQMNVKHSNGKALGRSQIKEKKKAPSTHIQQPITRNLASTSFTSPDLLNCRRSRSGRILVPKLDNVCQQIVYDADGAIAGIRIAMDAKSHTGSKSEPPRKRRRGHPT